MEQDCRSPDDEKSRTVHQPDGLTLRPWSPDDAAEMAAMANMPKFRHGTLRLPYESVAAWRSRIERSGTDNVCLLGIIGGRIVGTAGLFRLTGRRAHAAEVGMGVHDDWHGRGIATALLGALVDTADNWLGLRRLELSVYPDNEPAIRLYRRFGFEVEGTFRDFAFRDGRYVDALAMARLA